MHYPLLLAFLSLVCIPVQAQKDSVAAKAERSFLYRHHHKYGFEESSLGLLPEISFFGDCAVGLGLSKGRFGAGCVGSGGSALTLGYAYSPSSKLSILYASAWFSANAGFVGLYGGVRTFYFTNGHNGRPGIRPEIGYGLVRLNIFYGYNFFFNNELPGTGSRHSITLSGYIPFYPKKRNKNNPDPYSTFSR